MIFHLNLINCPRGQEGFFTIYYPYYLCELKPKMDEVSHFNFKTFPEINFLHRNYDEKLEAECILRIRSIFDEFVCPKTGNYMICTFSELLNGIQRLWALAQELKSYTPGIHEWIINLPLLFISVLLRTIEREYTQEDHEKASSDPQLGESLLTIFYDLYNKSMHFRRTRQQIIVFETCIMYVRHLLTILGLDSRIKRVKWNEIKVIRAKVFAPLRETDFIVVLEAFRHFRDEILPNFSKGTKIYYRLLIENRIPEVMESTREFQKNCAYFIMEASVIASVFSLILLALVGLIEGGEGGEGIGFEP